MEALKTATLSRYYWEFEPGEVELEVLCFNCYKDLVKQGENLQHAEDLDGSDGTRCWDCGILDEQGKILIREGWDI